MTSTAATPATQAKQNARPATAAPAGGKGAPARNGSVAPAAAKSTNARSTPTAAATSQFVLDGQRAHGRAFTAAEATTFETLHGLKPDLSAKACYEFCKKHDFSSSAMEREIAQEFECQTPTHTARGRETLCMHHTDRRVHRAGLFKLARVPSPSAD